MYVEQPEYEITCDGSDPIEREVYQIFLNVWGNTKTFFEYWQQEVEAEWQERFYSEVPQQTTYEASLEAAWPRKRIHKCVLRSPRHQARVHKGR